MMFKMPISRVNVIYIQLSSGSFFQAENLFQELQEHFQALTATLNIRNILFHFIANTEML